MGTAGVISVIMSLPGAIVLSWPASAGDSPPQPADTMIVRPGDQRPSVESQDIRLPGLPGAEIVRVPVAPLALIDHLRRIVAASAATLVVTVLFLLFSIVAIPTLALLALLLCGVRWASIRRTKRKLTKATKLAQVPQSDLADPNATESAPSSAPGVPGVLLDGDDADGRPFVLRIPGLVIADQGGAVIGRSPFDSTIVLDHAAVSRRHFRLSAGGNGVLIEDMNSRNGTKLNRRALTPGTEAPLAAGAVLEIGGLTLTVTCQHDQVTPDGPRPLGDTR